MRTKLPHAVALVPTWISDALRADVEIPPTTLLSLPKLHEMSILSPRDVCFYFYYNMQMQALTGELFHDMTPLPLIAENIRWRSEHEAMILSYGDSFKTSPIMKDLNKKIASIKKSPVSGIYFTPTACDDSGIVLMESNRSGLPSIEDTQNMASQSMDVLTRQLTFEVSKQYNVFEWLTVHGN